MAPGTELGEQKDQVCVYGFYRPFGEKGVGGRGEDLGCFTQIECRVPVGQPSGGGSDH